MNNFIFFTDAHLRLSSTRRRTDGLFEAQCQKLIWIGKRAKELNSSFVLCGGDLGDNWDWKISMINRVAGIFKEYPCPIYTIIGNHDVPGRNPELWKDTGLGILDSMEVVKVLIEDKYQLSDFTVFPFHSDEKKTDDLVNGKFAYHGPEVTGIKIAVVHAPVGAETTPFCKGHKELFLPDFDIALFGDVHPGWTPYTDLLSGCTICNPGAISRLDKTDIHRVPKIIVVKADKTIESEEIPHTEASKCFDLSGLEAEKIDLGKGFLAAIEARKINNDISPKDFVARVGTAGGFSQESIRILREEV